MPVFGLILTPTGLLLALLLGGTVAVWTGQFLWMMLPEILLAVASIYAVGFIAASALRSLEGADGGRSRMPSLNPIRCIVDAAWLIDVFTWGGLGLASERTFADELPRFMACALGFVGAFVAALAMTGQWASWMSTGRWDPTVPVAAAAVVGAIGFMAGHRLLGETLNGT